jgi:hypothetical protein
MPQLVPHPLFLVLHSYIGSTPCPSLLSLIDPFTSQGLTSIAYQVVCLSPTPKRHPLLVFFLA